MFLYFARLHEKFDLPVYPVVIFSYKAPKRPEPNRYEVAFPGKTVLQFEYTTIQLNRLPWRQFIEQPNPVAAALMSRMMMAARERPKVKLECLRLLATLKLDPAKSHLIGGFIESYLKLNAEENRQYTSEFDNLTPEGKERTMEMLTSWGRKGKEELVVLQMQRLFGSVSPTIIERVEKLPSKQLDDLGLALLDFKSVANLENWLLQHRPKRIRR